MRMAWACVFVLPMMVRAQVPVAEGTPSASPWLETVRAAHEVRLLDDDTAALENLLRMIGRARRTMELEYFVFEPDRSGRLVLQALVAKADEGVKIRILIDHSPHEMEPGLDESYGAALARHGIELRYFNVIDPVQFWKVGFRNHRKLLVVDDEEMLEGGRNIADGYFGMSEHMNYLDRDIWIKGPIARRAVQGFDLFWEAPVVERPRVLEEPVFVRQSSSAASTKGRTQAQEAAYYEICLKAFKSRLAETRETLTARQSDLELRQRVAERGGVELDRSPVVAVHSITLAVDTPTPGRAGRIATPYLHRRLAEVTRSLVIENFIFMVKGEEKRLFLGLLARGIRIDLLTNGFTSEPNGLMAEMANSRQNMAVDRGVNVYCYFSVPEADRIFSGKGAIWGLHTKTMVLDGRDSVIGSYNLDPRSESINDEGVIIVNDSPEFALLLKGEIRKRIESATRMNPDGSYANGFHCCSPARLATILLRPFVEMAGEQL